MITAFLIFLFVVVCVLLTLTILLQSSKGEGLASGVFGGAGAQAMLGGRGAATFLSKLTTGLAISYIVLSVILARFYGGTPAPKLEQPVPEAESAVSETVSGEAEAPAEDVESTPETTPGEGK